jgi:hypothetical protein
VGKEVARLVTEVEGASESQRPGLEQELASLRARGLCRDYAFRSVYVVCT